MIRAVLNSTKPVQIMGVGIVQPGEPVILDELAMRRFERIHGAKFGEANFPPHIDVEILVEVE